ncbi:hypothetical protein TMatcc_005587 [Talaromyces marneffei ATCC 18224]|uniref:Uncharacterized protein n=1 Tax=Talaromyces marneffei (strain ATCC 18224 / CBS 334.59 / QM 7333) TaxID=441960 RepID=B6Q9T2_TALMQ|nr:uncharacterized protein EYB26_005892 [Talaromyces marneffei]EEA26166.1 hypothetical protein PMAA_072440 [Talaromyces marneffei ATCC 18224]KAE8554868.1 hypothetical protein EYB25_003415 [Talaromyces marneffei]QGA18208.1 hypothetical protein EYB26_005892 [Talaromyces marneffei]
MYPIKSISKFVMPSIRTAYAPKRSQRTQSLHKFNTKQVSSIQKLVQETSCINQPSAIKEAPFDVTTTVKAKLCTPCPYPTTYIPTPHQYTTEQYAELSLYFENRVKTLWRRIWFGLYQAEDEEEVTHATRIRKLYAGAGMADLLRKPNYQDTTIYFRGYWEFIGLGRLSEVLVESGPTDCWPVIGRLKMYDGIALDNLQYISIILKEYEQQVDKLSELYQFLEKLQIPDPYYYGQPTDEHVKLVMRGFRERAGRVALSLVDLDAQMGAIQRSINKEALMLHGRLEGVEMLHFKKEVLKP